MDTVLAESVRPIAGHGTSGNEQNAFFQGHAVDRGRAGSIRNDHSSSGPTGGTDQAIETIGRPEPSILSENALLRGNVRAGIPVEVVQFVERKIQKLDVCGMGYGEELTVERRAKFSVLAWIKSFMAPPLVVLLKHQHCVA